MTIFRYVADRTACQRIFLCTPESGHFDADQRTCLLPGDRIHHREVHRGADEPAWWSKFRIDPYLVATALWAQTRPVRSVAEPTEHNELMAPPAASPELASFAQASNSPIAPEIAKRSQ